MSRLSELPVASLSPSQRQLFEAITGGKRGTGRRAETLLTPAGALRGPFNAMLHAPAPGAAAQALGACLRFEGSLDAAIREAVILLVAAHWRARYEWSAHVDLAREAGVPSALIDALAGGRARPECGPRMDSALDFARELLDERAVGDSTYRVAVGVLGESALVELTLLLGYYTLVAMILNAFDVGLPDGSTTPFDARRSS